MKKSAIALFLILGLCLTFVGCTNSNEPDITIPSASDNSDTNPQSSSPEETSSTNLTPVGESDDYFGIRKYKYRYNYYRITAPFVDIVGDKAYDEWIESNPSLTTKDLDEMLIVSYIKHFNITREQFDEANRNREKLFEENNWTMLVYPFENTDGIYSYDDELYEIYNADIIYTFDNDIINEYYARPPEVIIENGTNALGEKVD